MIECVSPRRVVLNAQYSVRKGEPKSAASVHRGRCDGENHDRVTDVCGAFHEMPRAGTHEVANGVGRDCQKCVAWERLGYGRGHVVRPFARDAQANASEGSGGGP